ncbi:hypothetical protein SERLA73DRAFT_188952 [Serpula lacrymans var. lacrymans S7.3]|uniref:Uncharacterized protein n=1 Tax=Serpula lacrymans var. lacrymans (strain S7.3) TaxID=936435 RepID=F8QCH4_SERL3|nr:hypothetical protein SERLA73DRAFT_188952 [Serpula lacrymans var. lacrymans S7.3]
MGPSPSNFGDFQPTSFMGNDHSPIEFSWVIDSENKMTVRFTSEPLSIFDGTPTSPSTWIPYLNSLASSELVEGFDTTWCQICYNTLLHSSPVNRHGSQHMSQFSFGADLTSKGLVGKAYFLPHIRCQVSNLTTTKLTTNAMEIMGLETPWSTVTSYLSTLPEHFQANPEIVSIDCTAPSINRAKVYVRTQATHYHAIADFMTLGGQLSDPSIDAALSTLRHLWNLLFVGIDEDTPLTSSNPGHFTSGFVLYYEMTLDRPTPMPKAYIPVQHYCDSDAHIARALAQYYKETGNVSVGERYVSDVQAIFNHRDLSVRTGIQTYIGIAARKTGSQVSIYLCPELFASERMRPGQ